jgi:hypothetical protein
VEREKSDGGRREVGRGTAAHILTMVALAEESALETLVAV